MHTLEVSTNTVWYDGIIFIFISALQVEWLTEVPSLVLVLDLSFWMKYSAVQVLVNYLSAPVGQFCPMTALMLTMLVLGVKVCSSVNKGESLYLNILVTCKKIIYANIYMYIITIHSSLCKWPVATGWWKYCKWRQSGDLYEQWVGNSVWWLLE